MSEQKTCKQCGQKFEVTEDDLDFLTKISPELNGKKYLISSPQLCYECRQEKRYGWRNERHLYKRKCDLTGEDIVSVYSPDKPFKVYSNSAFKSDKWDSMSNGVDFDFSQSFFEQFKKLMEKVPRQANNCVANENCDFCNQSWHSKDSYLSFNLGYGERCYYCNDSFYVKDCIDTFDVRNCEFSYHLFNCGNCYNSQFLEHCKDCSECFFSYDCLGCQNVILSAGLRNKQYFIRNKQYSKEEYFKELDKMGLNTHSGQKKIDEKFVEIKKNAIHKENNNLKSEDCTGDYILESKNCHDCYNIFRSEDCCKVTNIDDKGRDSRDVDFIAECELCYGGISIAGYKNILSAFVPYGENNYYCNFCENCKNCFGCIGLTRKEYCILNKQYSKEEYEKLVSKIIERMVVDEEWGEFFPLSASPHAYNETIAQNYYPKNKEDVEKIGGSWLDKNYETEFTGDFYEPKDDINEYLGNEDEIKKLLEGVIKCEKTGKPFKIIPQELSFYLKNKIPIPTIHYLERFNQLFSLRNPRKLYHRQCMCEETGHGHNGRCGVEFETTYAPERPEKIYCEKCYQKSII